MLKALKNQLVQLSEINGDGFASKIRFRVSMEEGDAAVASLRNLILMMPELISQIRSWMNDPRVPERDKKLHGFMLTYLYHPIDFLPDSDHGLYGYLDDAYFVGCIYINSMQHMDFGSRRSQPNTEPLETAVPKWLDMTRKVLPHETKKIDEMISELLQGHLDAFSRLMSQEDRTEKEIA